MTMRAMGGQYDPPPNYGVPNPQGPRTHNWKGGPLNEGSLFHGPIYTRPSYRLPWARRPLNGPLGQQKDEGDKAAFLLPLIVIGGVLLVLCLPGAPPKGKRR